MNEEYCHEEYFEEPEEESDERKLYREDCDERARDMREALRC